MAEAKVKYHNPWDKATKEGLHIASDSSERNHSWKLRCADGKQYGFKSWAGLAKWARENLGVTGWERISVNRMGAWFPNNDSTDVPCEITVHRDDWHMSPCGRVALTDEPKIREMGGDVHACKMHLNGARKRAENSARWKAEWDAKGEAREAEKERRKAEEDFAAILRGKGFNVVVGKGDDKRIGVVFNGEVAVALVEQFELLAREMEIPAEDVAEIINDLTKGGRI